MKATNQFDYPTQAAQTFKNFKADNSRVSSVEAQEQKKRYQELLRQEKSAERQKVKEQQLRRKEQEKIENKQKIKAEIQRKKRELLELQRMQSQAIDNERKAYEMAILKEQQDRIKRVEEEQRQKDYEENAGVRFNQALRRLENQKEESNVKGRQAQHRRKVQSEMEKEERQKASRYQADLGEKEAQDKQRENQEEVKQGKQYRDGLNRHGITKLVDYTATCMHNPRIIVKSYLDQEDAITRAARQEAKLRQKTQQQQEKMEKQLTVSQERGRKALEKMQREQEYEEYCREAQKEQRQYNMTRIEAGKKNQFTGVKPLTLEQMEQDKKLRSQQEFEELFIKKNIEWEDHPVSRYLVVQRKMGDTPGKRSNSRKAQTEREDFESILPCESIGKYSFEESCGQSEKEEQPRQSVTQSGVPQVIEEYRKSKQLAEKQQTKKKEASNKKQGKVIEQGEPKQKVVSKQGTRQVVDHKQLSQTKIGNQKEEDLSYSQSQQDSNL